MAFWLQTKALPSFHCQKNEGTRTIASSLDSRSDEKAGRERKGKQEKKENKRKRKMKQRWRECGENQN